MAEVIFFIAAIVALAGAIGVIWARNPFFSVLALVAHLLALAALFLLLRAEFVAAVQVIVYAGAVMVLYVFVVAYVGGGGEPALTPLGPNLRPLSVLFIGVVFVELCVALLGSGLQEIDTEGAPYAAGFGSPGQIGELLLTHFLLAFELASLLLLVAAVGGVVLARRRHAATPDAARGVISAMDLLRPGTGSMTEAVRGLPETHDGEERPEITAGAQDEERGW